MRGYKEAIAAHPKSLLLDYDPLEPFLLSGLQKFQTARRMHVQVHNTLDEVVAIPGMAKGEYWA